MAASLAEADVKKKKATTAARPRAGPCAATPLAHTDTALAQAAAAAGTKGHGRQVLDEILTRDEHDQVLSVFGVLGHHGT